MHSNNGEGGGVNDIDEIFLRRVLLSRKQKFQGFFFLCSVSKTSLVRY